MPWHVEKQGEEFCVIKDADGTKVACHPTKAEADAQVKALYAAKEPGGKGDGKKPNPFEKQQKAAQQFAARIEEQDGKYCVVEDGSEPTCYDTRAEAEDALASSMKDNVKATAQGAAFTLFITVEGLETHDGRLFERGGLEPRATLPIPLMVQERSEHGGMMGDTTAWFAGAIEEVFRDERDDTRWLGRGHLMASERGTKAEDLIRGGLSFVSVDASADDVTLDIRAVNQDGVPIDALYRYAKGRIMGATVTPFPAFEQCTIWFEDQPEPAHVALTHGTDIPLTKTPAEVEQDMPLLLLAGGGPVAPPAAWFDNPALPGPTPLTVLEDGRVYGHIASWNTCHIGTQDTCITAPTSPSSYAYFHTGEIVAAGGARIAVGTLTLGTGHARLGDSARGAMAHYDDTGVAAADVRCGEDDYGIWCAGTVRPHLSERDIRALMAAAPSGDWRRINGFLELVAVLAVNVPGFPIPRTQARVASGAEQALVAAPGPGVMDWIPRFANKADKTPELFMRTLRKMIHDAVAMALRGETPIDEMDDDEPPAPVLSADEARARHIVAPPLEPNADPKRAKLEARKREIKTALRAG